MLKSAPPPGAVLKASESVFNYQHRQNKNMSLNWQLIAQFKLAYQRLVLWVYVVFVSLLRKEKSIKTAFSFKECISTTFPIKTNYWYPNTISSRFITLQSSLLSWSFISSSSSHSIVVSHSATKFISVQFHPRNRQYSLSFLSLSCFNFWLFACFCDWHQLNFSTHSFLAFEVSFLYPIFVRDVLFPILVGFYSSIRGGAFENGLTCLDLWHSLIIHSYGW